MATRQYIGARYVPKFADPAEWDNTQTYDPLTIVLNEGNSYTAKKNVPAGVDISNEAYWVCTGNYNQQVASMATQITNMQSEVTSATEAAETATTAAAEATSAAKEATKAADEAAANVSTAAGNAQQALNGLDNVGAWNSDYTEYTLNTATETTPGGIISSASSNTAGLVVVNADGTATIPVATSSGYGLVKPDNDTIVIDNGVLAATTKINVVDWESLGCTKISGSTAGVDTVSLTIDDTEFDFRLKGSLLTQYVSAASMDVYIKASVTDGVGTIAFGGIDASFTTSTDTTLGYLLWYGFKIEVGINGNYGSSLPSFPSYNSGIGLTCPIRYYSAKVSPTPISFYAIPGSTLLTSMPMGITREAMSDGGNVCYRAYNASTYNTYTTSISSGTTVHIGCNPHMFSPPTITFSSVA